MVHARTRNVGRERRVFVAGLVAWLMASATAIGQSPNAPAEFKVTSSVRNPAPQRIGTNLTFDWVTENFVIDPGFEPSTIRHRFEATGGGMDYILISETPWTSVWDTLGDHFFDGAEVRIYRDTGTNWFLLRQDKVKFYHAPPSPAPPEDYRIDLEQIGPPVQQHDFVFISMNPTEAPVDKMHERMEWIPLSDTWDLQPLVPNTPAYYKIRDDTTSAPGVGGRSSLKFHVDNAQIAAMRQYRYLRDKGPVLTAGKQYTVRLWMKREGIPSGLVRFFMTEDYSSVDHTWWVSDQWQEYTYTFTAPTLNTYVGVQQILTFQGPGTLWIDNIAVHESGVAPGAVKPVVVDALKAMKPGTIRLWAGHTNTEWGTSLESWTSDHFNAQLTWSTNAGRYPPLGPTLPASLDLCKQVGANPWLIVNQSFSEQEWSDLIDYLAGPTWTTYGAKRAGQGHPAPWTDDFGKVYVELGNETWNWIFYPWSVWPGSIYGKQVQLFFQAAKSNPHFAAAADKLVLMHNGWVLQGDPIGFGATAAEQATLSDGWDLTAYTGGWELGGTLGGTVLNDEGFHNTLMFLPAVHRYFVDIHDQTRALFAAQGRNVQLGVYEGGPSYNLPTATQPFHPVTEAYGKSLANAVSTLDCFLYGSLNRMDPQTYFEFKPGFNWSSHTLLHEDFRPHASWLALQLRNQHVPDGSAMVDVETISVPTIFMPANPYVPPTPEAAMVGCYAFRKDLGATSEWSVFLLSRKLKDATPVTLQLPAPPVGPVNQIVLRGDPMSSNIDAPNLSIQEGTIRAWSQTPTFQLPPGAIHLYQFTTAN